MGKALSDSLRGGDSSAAGGIAISIARAYGTRVLFNILLPASEALTPLGVVVFIATVGSFLLPSAKVEAPTDKTAPPPITRSNLPESEDKPTSGGWAGEDKPTSGSIV
jgi:hypothetical protein